jgi:hypothetical protein
MDDSSLARLHHGRWKRIRGSWSPHPELDSSNRCKTVGLEGWPRCRTGTPEKKGKVLLLIKIIGAFLVTKRLGQRVPRKTQQPLTESVSVAVGLSFPREGAGRPSCNPEQSLWQGERAPEAVLAVTWGLLLTMTLLIALMSSSRKNEIAKESWEI